MFAQWGQTENRQKKGLVSLRLHCDAMCAYGTGNQAEGEREGALQSSILTKSYK